MTQLNVPGFGCCVIVIVRCITSPFKEGTDSHQGVNGEGPHRRSRRRGKRQAVELDPPLDVRFTRGNARGCCSVAYQILNECVGTLNCSSVL